MTSKLVLFILFPLLIISLLLALVGVQHIEFGDTYYNFLKDVNRSYQQWSFQIPNIPSIPQLADTSFDDSGLILGVLIKIGRAVIGFFNILIGIINVMVMVINVLIQLIQFFLTLIYRLIGFRDSLSQVVFVS